jgi:DNA-binding NarL/FixJ family response regulator
VQAKQRVLIVENHALLRAGLRALLAGNPDLDVIGEAANGLDAIRSVRLLEPTLVLMDISMPGMNGIEAIIDIKRRHPHVRIIVITIHREGEYIDSSLRAGADGYLLKDSSNEEFQQAMRVVSCGKTYISPAISGEMIHRYLRENGSAPGEMVAARLTHRERQVLKLIAEGHRNKFIAEYFSLSVKTIEKHRSNLMQKLDLHNSSMLTSYAIQHGLLKS